MKFLISLVLLFASLNNLYASERGLENFLSLLKKKMESSRSYQVEMELEVGGETQKQIYQFTWPNNYRVKQTSSFHRGAVATINSAKPNKIIIQPNRWHLPKEIELDESSKLATSITGDGLQQSDINSVLSFAMEVFESGRAKCELEEKKEYNKLQCSFLGKLKHKHFNLDGVDQIIFYFNHKLQLTRLLRYQEGTKISSIRWIWPSNQRVNYFIGETNAK